MGGSNAVTTIDPSINILSVCNQESSLASYDGFLASLLSTYFQEKVSVKVQVKEDFLNYERLSWLRFDISQRKFAIAKEREWSSAVGLQAILQWQHTDEKKELETRSLINLVGSENLEDRFSGLHIFKYSCKRGQEIFNAWLAMEVDCQLPILPIPFERNCNIKLALNIDLGFGRIGKTLKLLHPMLRFFPSKILSGKATYFSSALMSTTAEQVLKIEEDSMNENISLRTSIRLGALEMALKDFLSLKPGSQIRFNLPEKSMVELEIGGSVVGRGEFCVEDDGFLLGIEEVIGKEN